MTLITISSGTTVSGTVVSNGDTLEVFGTAVDTTVNSGGSVINSGTMNGGGGIGGVAVVVSGGGSVINSGIMSGVVAVDVVGSGAATIDNFGTIRGTEEGYPAIGLGAGADLVVLEGGSTLRGVSGDIGGFAPGDEIVLRDVPWSTSDTLDWSGNTTQTRPHLYTEGTLTVSGGGTTETLNLTGVSDLAVFKLTSASGGGTLVTETLGTPLAIGTTTTGSIDNVGDKHQYQVELTKGTRYAFNLDGYDISSSYSLRDPYLRLLDSTGNVIATSDDISSRNWSSEIDYTATGSGIYTLEASSSPADGTYTTGSYQFRSSTATPLKIGTTATGEITYVGGKDVYQVTLAPGTPYTINLDGYDISSSYSLRDPYLQLLDSNGNVVTASDDVSSANWSSEIHYTSNSGGTYYLEASSSPSDGTYTIGNYQIRSSAPTPLAIGTTAAGEISYAGGMQEYKVTTTAGTRYAFNLDGYDTSSSYSLRDPYLQLVDSDGNVIATSDDISSTNWSSEIDYTAANSFYYLVAASSPSDGTYTTGNYGIRSSVISAPSRAIAPAADQSNQNGPTIVPVPSGDQTLTAGPKAETFDFSNLGFGKDTIVGFDPAQDALRLSSSLARDIAAVSADMSVTAAGGTLIALDQTHSITLDGVAPASLSASNFRFV